MPSLNNREKQPETQPIWGQFHFFPNGSQIEMEASRHHLENNPSNFSLHATATASFSSHISNSGNPFLHHGDHRYPPIVLLPSSYDLAKTANGHAGEEGCFNVILVGGCLLLVGTVSAAVALISGFIWNVHNLFRKLVITHVIDPALSSAAAAAADRIHSMQFSSNGTEKGKRKN